MSARPWIPDRLFDSMVYGLLKDMRSAGCRLSIHGSGLLILYPGDHAYERFAGSVYAHREEIRSLLTAEAATAPRRKELHDAYDDQRLDRRPNGSDRATPATSHASRSTSRTYRAGGRDVAADGE